MEDRIVEVIEVHFVLRLKLMEEVEQAEGKHSMQPN